MNFPRMGRRSRLSPWRAIAIGATTWTAAKLLLRGYPALESEVFAQGAGRLAGVLIGSPVVRAEHGWRLPTAATPVEITVACSAADFACLVAGLVSWQLAKRQPRSTLAVASGLALAVPLAIAVNAVRIATLAQVHRWVIPLLPPTYAAFTHLFTGVAIFLPALIGINLLLEHHGNRHAPTTGRC